MNPIAGSSAPINNKIPDANEKDNMIDTPSGVEEKYIRFLNALKTLAPDKTFGGITVDQFETQIGKSSAARDNIQTHDNERKQEEANRDREDAVTLKYCNVIKHGVLADPEFGDDSALLEALGYTRRSDRKSGLTRRRNAAETVKV